MALGHLKYIYCDTQEPRERAPAALDGLPAAARGSFEGEVKPWRPPVEGRTIKRHSRLLFPRGWLVSVVLPCT